MVSKKDLLDKLPPFRDKWIVRHSGNQTINQLINYILDSHERNRKYYDQIAAEFDNGQSVEKICTTLYQFVQKNVKYKEEPGKLQTTSIPAGILIRGQGDCKHYASFIGGVLDALNRAGRRIKWAYRFVSYDPKDQRPRHVFVVVNDKGRELWIDPVPGADRVSPFWQMDATV